MDLFLLDEERLFNQALLCGLGSSALKGVDSMSLSTDLRFPNGHTVEQVKRNAKRLSKEQGVPVSKALDQLAGLSLGLTKNSIRWAEALIALEKTIRYYRIPSSFSAQQETQDAFTQGVVVSIDIKDSMEFTETGPWVFDEELTILMTPTILAHHALLGAEEDGRKIPDEQDWEYACDDLMNRTLYRYTGSNVFSGIVEIVQDICKRNFFPPDDVWMNGQLVDIPRTIVL